MDSTLECQPPNSPDLNILDLGFFRSIQKIQYEKVPKSVSALVDAVTKAYDECNPKCLHYNWLSLQYCMNEILRVKGNNNYKLPHVVRKDLIDWVFYQKKFNQQRNTLRLLYNIWKKLVMLVLEKVLGKVGKH
ncbi:hypothetical protein RND81_06G076700 [Saponaria officinalis]|uniref:Uncharacterized protein n=1 Tax=Saponaria officinalis TaxID=3572 RepID=A0AAW1K4J6_SAPOF